MKRYFYEKMTRFFTYLQNPAVDIDRRLFLALSVVALGGLFTAFLGGFLIGENALSLLFTAVGFMVFFAIVFIGIRLDQVPLVSVILSIVLVCGFLPVTFFTSGGVYGGTPIWCVFVSVYIAMILTSMRRRIFFFILEAAVVNVCWYVQYQHPELVMAHTDEAVFLDSMGSLYIVSIVMSIFVGFQHMLYKEENQRFAEQKKQIEELNATQNRFFSSMSHEIRTPINTIIGFNEMILRENASQEINEDAENIKAASTILLHLINDILDVSKLESGQMELETQPYQTGEMLSDIAGMFWLMAQEKGLAFSMDIAPEVPSTLLGDDIRIRQILINVINNAIKYTPEGNVALSVTTERRDRGDVDVVYTVKDTGIGIRKESIPYLFDAFSRIDEDGTRFIEGTGLGLSIVRQFVDLMGGTINVNSIYTKGSTFVISIPQRIVDDTPVGDVSFERRRDPDRRTPYTTSFEAPQAKVLVVDDTEANLLVVEKLLRETKVAVTLAGSGEEALNATLDTAFDVIFMDHLMPNMDGIECARRIRSQTGGMSRKAAIVALTANVGSTQAALYEKEGFDGYLVKPVDGTTLESELLRLLPATMVSLTVSDENLVRESLMNRKTHHKKALVLVTTESVADLPPDIARDYPVRILPYKIVAETGIFRDNEQVQTIGMTAYLEQGRKAYARAPQTEEYERFFANSLEQAMDVVHIALSSSVQRGGIEAAMEAAQSFDNVTVIDSQNMSVGQGMLVMTALKLAKDGADAEHIIQAVSDMRPRIRTSFICDQFDYLLRQYQVSPFFAKLAKAFLMRPMLRVIEGRLSLYGIRVGSRRNAMKSYIRSVLSMGPSIDKSLLVVVHAGLDADDLRWIVQQVSKKIAFEEVRIVTASPAITVNCGPGSFGLVVRTV